MAAKLATLPSKQEGREEEEVGVCSHPRLIRNYLKMSTLTTHDARDSRTARTDAAAVSATATAAAAVCNLHTPRPRDPNWRQISATRNPNKGSRLCGKANFHRLQSMWHASALQVARCASSVPHLFCRRTKVCCTKQENIKIYWWWALIYSLQIMWKYFYLNNDKEI